MSEEIGTRNAIVAVGTASVLLAPQRLQGRKNIYIKNISTGGEIITVVFSNTQNAVANTGYVLNPTEFLSDSDSGGSYECYDGNVSAICSGAGGQVSIVERC